MIRINIAYAKKIPASTEFSSQNFHCSIDSEVMSSDEKEIREHIRQQFILVKTAVEAEIHGGAVNGNVQVINTPPAPASRQIPARSNNANDNRANGNGGRNPNEPASNRQISFAVDLLKKGGYDIAATCANYGVASLYDLSRKQCSEIIDGLQQQKVA